GSSSLFWAFCISPDKVMPPSSGNPFEITATSYTSGSGTSTYDQLARLVDWGKTTATYDLFSDISPYDTTKNEYAAAFQVVLWMVLTGGSSTDYNGGQTSGLATWLVNNVAMNVGLTGKQMALL